MCKCLTVALLVSLNLSQSRLCKLFQLFRHQCKSAFGCLGANQMLFADKKQDGDAWNQEEDIWRWLSWTGVLLSTQVIGGKRWAWSSNFWESANQVKYGTLWSRSFAIQVDFMIQENLQIIDLTNCHRDENLPSGVTVYLVLATKYHRHSASLWNKNFPRAQTCGLYLWEWHSQSSDMI